MARFVTLIAGNIGSGKSELLNYIGQNKGGFDPLLGKEEKVVTVPEFIDPVSLEIFYGTRELVAAFPRHGPEVVEELAGVLHACFDREFNGFADEEVMRSIDRCLKENPLANLVRKHLHIFRDGLAREAQVGTEIFEESNLIGRINRHLKAKHDSGFYFFDRGMIEGAETFARTSFDDGYLTHEAHERYQNRLLRALDQLGKEVQSAWLEGLVVYLKVDDIGVLQARQRKRNTKGEVVPAEYLGRLNRRYDALFRNIEKVYRQDYGVKAPEVLTIEDAHTDFNEDSGYLPRTLENIIDKMKEMGLDAAAGR